MWYKEWRQARFKGLAASLTYALISAYAVISWVFGRNDEGLLDKWYIPALIATSALAALGGMDAVSEEKDRGTLSFLLTRPISRTYIYKVKLLINLGWLSAIYGVFSLVISALSQIKLFHFYVYYSPHYLENYSNVYINIEVTRVWRPSQVLTTLLLILMIGITIMCYTAFVSIFARTTVETIVFSGLIVLSFAIFVAIVVAVLHNSIRTPYWFGQPPGFLMASVILASVALGFYWGGRAVFNRHEF